MMSPPHDLRVAHVLAPARFGGLESVVRALAVGHAARDHEITVIQVLEHGEATPPMTFGAEDRVASHVVRVARRRYWQERAAVRSICHDARVQVVHTHGYRPDIVDSGVAPRLRAARVTTVHGYTGGSLKNRVFEGLQLRAFRRFEAVVAVSQPLARLLVARGVSEDRLHTLPNAWLPGRAAPMSRDAARAALGVADPAPVIGWVGRLSREKGPDVFVDALIALRDMQWTAVIIGDGPMGAALRDRTAAAGLSERIRFVGVMPNAARCFPGFDLFAMSSRTEGTPIVLFEAMAAGVPVVTTGVGGIPDVVSNGEAVLVPAENAIALANGLRSTLVDGRAARARADAARTRLHAVYAADPWLDRYEDVYRAAIGRVAH